MSFSITIGWWILPTLATIAAYAWHSWMHWGEDRGSGYGSVGSAIGEAFTFLIFIVVSLAAWCLYFGIWSLF